VPPHAPLVVDAPQRVGLVAAELVLNRLLARPRARLLLPPGRTPRGMYEALREHAALGQLPSAEATVIQLAEYAGVGPDDPRSFAARLRAELDGIPLAAVHVLDGAAADPAAEADRHAAIVEQERIDLAVLGLGRDGHVGFNEPPAPLASGVRTVALTAVTREDAGYDAAARAYTVGLGTLHHARELILLVTGRAKAEALRATLEGPAGPDCPASLLRDHPRLTVICDREAAALLRPRPGWASDRVLVVLGHREPGISAEHRISAQSRARLRHALHHARKHPVRAVVLTGYTATGGLSEAEQMKGSWDESVAPALLEVAGRDTAENASRSLPILLALGEARQVSVVSSAWHLRVPFFFQPYRRFGMSLTFRGPLARGSWRRMVGHEFRSMPRAWGDRRRAMAAMIPPP